MSNDYYVYMYLRETDSTPYYIGKGKGKRYKKRHGVNIPPKTENIVFVKQNITNEEACNLERELIDLYGRKDIGKGILHNKTDGGDGGDTSNSENYKKWLYTEARNKDSEYIKNVSARMKEKNPLHNKEILKKCHSKEIHEKISRANKGKKKSEEHKKKIKEVILKQSEEISARSKKLWQDTEHRNKLLKKIKEGNDKTRNMTEEDFYIWISDKDLFSYSNGIKRPNGRVKHIIDYFEKTDEFYGEYFNSKKDKQKNWEYYKNSSNEEFEEWISKQNLYRIDGEKNPRIYSVIRHRGLIETYYSPKEFTSA